jgi:thioredoxin reductase
VTLHGGLIVEACVTEAKKLSADRFHLSAERQGQSETFETRRLLLATGLRDLTPDCSGFRQFYGTSVHHCPDCDGYECRNKRIAVLGGGKKTVGFALSLLTWTNKITLITGGDAGDMTADDRVKLSNFNIQIIDRSIVALEGNLESKQLERVLLQEGDSIACESLFFNLGTKLASNLHEMLGCKLDDESGLVWVDESQQTSVPGVYAAGDITPNSQLAVVAAAEGAMAAIHLHQSLIPSERKI